MRLIDADELRKHAVESDHINGVMLVVSLGHILYAPTIDLEQYNANQRSKEENK